MAVQFCEIKSLPVLSCPIVFGEKFDTCYFAHCINVGRKYPALAVGQVSTRVSQHDCNGINRSSVPQPLVYPLSSTSFRHVGVFTICLLRFFKKYFLDSSWRTLFCQQRRVVERKRKSVTGTKLDIKLTRRGRHHF